MVVIVHTGRMNQRGFAILQKEGDKAAGRLAARSRSHERKKAFMLRIRGVLAFSISNT